MISQKEIRTYLKQVKKNCPSSFRKKLAGELESSLFDYVDGHPDSTMEDIVVHFGLPERYVREYIRALDDSVCQKIVSRSKRIKRCVLIGTIIAVLIVAGAAIKLVQIISESTVYSWEVIVTDEGREEIISDGDGDNDNDTIPPS